MPKCIYCDNEAEVGNMCASCINGFNSTNNVRRSDIMKEAVMTNCKVCGNLSNSDKCICDSCIQYYFPQIKKFIDNNPGISYQDAIFHKDLPVSGKVLYEFCKNGIVKIK